MKFEEEYFEHNDVKVRYLKGGIGQAILFLHGAGVSAIAYRNLLQLLADKYKIIAPDLPCFGKSSIVEDWDFTDYAKFFDAFMKSIRLKKIILVGHSFGGGVAFNLAAINSQIKKLVLIDPAGIPLDCRPTELYIRFVIKNIKELFIFRKFSIFFAVLKSFIINLITTSLQLPTVIRTVNKVMYTAYDVFNKIRVKTIILWGDNDELFPKRFAKIFRRKIRKSKLFYVDGNHDFLLTNPEKFFKIIDDC